MILAETANSFRPCYRDLLMERQRVERASQQHEALLTSAKVVTDRMRATLRQAAITLSVQEVDERFRRAFPVGAA